ARGQWHGRGSSVLSGGAPFYTVYRCSDGGWMSVGSIESKFYAQLLKGLDLDESFLQRQHDRAHWTADRAAIAAVFAGQPRDHWAAVFAGTDACTYPVLDLDEVARDPHVSERGSVILTADGVPAVSPAPKLSETPGAAGAPPRTTRAAQLAILAESGISTEDIERYRDSGALHLAD